MLDLSKPLTAGKIKEYFKEEYGASENSYFSQGGAIRGEWHGELRNTFGLSGPVEGEAFNRLAEGQHPLTGDNLSNTKTPSKQRAVRSWAIVLDGTLRSSLESPSSSTVGRASAAVD